MYCGVTDPDNMHTQDLDCLLRTSMMRGGLKMITVASQIRDEFPTLLLIRGEDFNMTTVFEILGLYLGPFGIFPLRRTVDTFAIDSDKIMSYYARGIVGCDCLLCRMLAETNHRRHPSGGAMDAGGKCFSVSFCMLLYDGSNTTGPHTDAVMINFLECDSD
jgi:hypothetical protein